MSEEEKNLNDDEVEPEAEPEIEPDPELETEPNPEPEVEPKAEADSTESEPEPRAEVELEAEPAAEERHCKKCGAALHEGMNFCGVCGTDNSPVVEAGASEPEATAIAPVPEAPLATTPVEPAAEKADKPKVKLPKKFVPIAIAAAIVVVAAVVAAMVLPDALATPKQLFEQQKYEKAFEKATDDERSELLGLFVADGDFASAYQYANSSEKTDVLKANLAAHVSQSVTSLLKDPHSYELRDMWISGDNVILQVQGTNSYGGSVSAYWYFIHEDDGTYDYMACVSDLEQESASKYDSTSEKRQKVINNLARLVIEKVISDSSCEVGKTPIDWTNALFSSKQSFDGVTLLDDVSTLHGGSNTSGSAGAQS